MSQPIPRPYLRKISLAAKGWNGIEALSNSEELWKSEELHYIQSFHLNLPKDKIINNPKPYMKKYQMLIFLKTN